MGKGSSFKFRYDPNTKIFYKKHFGNITREEIFKSWDHAIESNLIPKDTVGFIVDFLDAHLNLALKDAKLIPYYFNSHTDIFGYRKIAIIVRSPKEIVVPILIQYAQKKYYLKPFSTEEAAVNWIQGKVSFF